MLEIMKKTYIEITEREENILLMLRTSFIAMYKNLDVLGMAGLRPPAEHSI